MKYVLLLCLFLSTGLYASIPPEIVVKGYVLSFDKKNVTISNPLKDIVVPRSSIAKRYKVKVGRYVAATISSDFILKNIKKRKKKASKQRIKNRYKKK